MKKIRQRKLLELISQFEIETQDELISRLRENGFAVTQATVSRDIRELKIAKMTTGKGTYRYVLPRASEPIDTGMKFTSAMTESIVSVDHSCNIIVIKTSPGLANAVAVGIDSMNMPQILGCVAGDDTIIVVSRDEECANQIADRFHDLMNQI